MNAAPLPDAEARAQALDLSAHVLVMAPAGSGKTGLLVHRMLRALATGDAPEQVVAITFTNKAAAEIRARLLDQLGAAQRGESGESEHEQALYRSAAAVLARDAERGWNLLAQPGRLSALTIDAFCAQIGAQLPLLSGLGGAMRIAEDPRALYEDAIARLFEEIEDASVPVDDRTALARVLRLSGNRLDRLIEPLCGLLARREQWLQPSVATTPEEWEAQDARALSALIQPALEAFHACFDARERTELLEVLREGSAESEHLIWASALHAWPAAEPACLRMLRQLAGLLLTQQDTLRKSVTVNDGFIAKRPYTQRFKAWLTSRQDDSALERAAATLRALPDPELPADLIELRRAWLRVLRRLAGHLRLTVADTQQADFPELAQAALAALRAEGAIGEALLAADRRIRHLLVDEMQDTSEMQVELIERLTAGWTAGDGRSLFLVGDPQQSIYAFRKAEVRLFLNLWDQARLQHLPLRTLRLSANFRSQPAVVHWFNRAFEQIFPRVADIQRGAVAFSPSVPLRIAEGEGGVNLRPCVDALAEAEAVAEDAARLAAPDRSVVVLARARSHLEPVIRALRARGLTPACQDIDPLAALPEVRDLLALAQALWHPEDRLSWAVLLRAPFVGLSWADLVALSVGRVREAWPQRIAAALDADTLSDEGRARLQGLRAALEQTAQHGSLRAELADRVEAVWHMLGGPACCSRAALDDVRQALRCLRAETRGGGIRDLESLKRRIAELYAAPQPGQVQLMTVHKAKGLEFDHVLLVGLNRGTRGEDAPPLHLFEFDGAPLLVPKPDEAWPEDHPAHRSYRCLQTLYVASRRNETLRLLYVAVTRTKRSATLYLSAPRDDKTGAVKLKSNSFAGALEPVIREEVERLLPARAATQVEAQAEQFAPRAPCLRLDFVLPIETDLYRPQETRTSRPSEAVLASQEEPDARRDEGDLYAQLVGTLFHEAMQRVAAEGLAAWPDAGASKRSSMAAGLRRRGMPEPLVEPAVTRVIELLTRTLASATGRWIVSPKPWSRSEYPLAGRRDGRWISAVIDRCFEDEDGLLWVIDYKTSARAVPVEQIESYIALGAEKYRGQIEQYASLLAGMRPDRRIRGALYFAEADRLLTIDPAK
ncbi:MAG: UvrD-helicase domain-containing protein [Panacagrimonas sp.]